MVKSHKIISLGTYNTYQKSHILLNLSLQVVIPMGNFRSCLIADYILLSKRLGRRRGVVIIILENNNNNHY